MNSYKSLLDYLSKGHNKDERPIKGKRATWVVRPNDHSVAIRYHHTDVITFYSDGTVKLYAGRWQSATTKARMNQHLPHHFQVYQKDGAWYLWNWETKEEWNFHDNMVIYLDGTVKEW